MLLSRGLVRVSSRSSSSSSSPSSFVNILHRRFATADDWKLNLSLVCPHRPIFLDKKVERVTINATTGLVGIGKGYGPTITELAPGVVIVDDAGKTEKYFVSGGFTFVNPDTSCVISAIEAVPLDNLDPDAARSGYQTFQQELSRATDDQSRAKAQIGVDVHKQMCFALGISV